MCSFLVIIVATVRSKSIEGMIIIAFPCIHGKHSDFVAYLHSDFHYVRWFIVAS